MNVFNFKVVLLGEGKKKKTQPIYFIYIFLHIYFIYFLQDVSGRPHLCYVTSTTNSTTNT